MTIKKSLAGVSFLILLLLAGCSSQRTVPPAIAEDTKGYPFKVGLAEVDITPPVGFRMAGYYDERFSTGVHDPLKAKAIVLEEGGTRVAFVMCDLVGLSLHVTTNARAAASRLTGIPVSSIVMAATHSHTGPLFDDVRRDYFHDLSVKETGGDTHEILDYPAVLTERLAKVVQDANAHLAPAEVDEGIATQAGLPFNRRYHMTNGRVVFNPGQLNPKIVGPAGPVDPDIGILMFKNSRHLPIGGLTVFAMHADTVGGTEFSADYPHFIEETLRGALGQDYLSVFGAGTCGDLNHIDVSKVENVKGVSVAQKLGTEIGNTILKDLPKLRPIDHPTLASESLTLRLPLQEISPGELSRGRQDITRLADTNFDFYAKVRAVKAVDLARLGSTIPMEVQVFRLDARTAIVCLPAEIFVEFGLGIKKASPFPDTMVISICNNRPGYVPTLKAFSEGSYEVINSRLKPGGGEAMAQTAIRLLEELKSK